MALVIDVMFVSLIMNEVETFLCVYKAVCISFSINWLLMFFAYFSTHLFCVDL